MLSKKLNIFLFNSSFLGKNVEKLPPYRKKSLLAKLVINFSSTHPKKITHFYFSTMCYLTHMFLSAFGAPKEILRI
jgi:hypothetical protein